MSSSFRKDRKYKNRILFVRIGWMRFYNGSVAGDERPKGGGKYNKNKIGHELYNFRNISDRLYGYFQPTVGSNKVALERIEVGAEAKSQLKNVLVVFVATRPEGGQAIVGWFDDATVFREQIEQSPGKPKGYGYYCLAQRKKSVLLPTEKRNFSISRSSGGFGRSNVCYPLEKNGNAKSASWIQNAVNFVRDYEADNILENPEVDADGESAAAFERALAQSKGQGFASTPEARRAIEELAMSKAKKHFRSLGFLTEDVSSRRPYDLLCKKSSEVLHVEVKGTTTIGEAVVLTNNEAKHARDGTNSCALFVLHSIQLKGKTASGGKMKLIMPWRVKELSLTPISYIYRL